jgi:DNA-binding transcriptional LysR family regulator
MMNFRQIEAFRAVMECGSMTAAASALGISQPNVSRLVAQLEIATRLRLFDRRAGRLVATADGNAFYAEVEKSFSGLRRLQHAANDIRIFGQGRLRIAAVPALGYGFLPRVISRFTQSDSDVTVSLQLRSSATTMEWAAAQQCDLGLASNVTAVPGVDIDAFGELDGVCIMPPGHRLASSRVVRPANLAGERFVSLPLDDATRRRIDEIFDAAGIQRILSLETQYSATVCALVAEGAGVAIVNPIAVRDFLHRGLVLRRFEPKVTFRSFVLIPRHRPQSRIATEFLSMMRQGFDQEKQLIRSTLTGAR